MRPQNGHGKSCGATRRHARTGERDRSRPESPDLPFLPGATLLARQRRVARDHVKSLAFIVFYASSLNRTLIGMFCRNSGGRSLTAVGPSPILACIAGGPAALTKLYVAVREERDTEEREALAFNTERLGRLSVVLCFFSQLISPVVRSSVSSAGGRCAKVSVLMCKVRVHDVEHGRAAIV